MAPNQLNMFEAASEVGIKRIELEDADVTLFENFFSEDESELLYKRLSENILWQQDQIRYYGKDINLPRLTAWYGNPNKSYTYSGITMNSHPWTDDLLRIKNKIEKEAGTQFNSVLLNLYRNGSDGVSWHSDNEKELGIAPIIGSVSFGESRCFQMRHLFKKYLDKVDIPLTNGSFLLMRGATQSFWQHQIAKTSRPVGKRINLTFRVI